MDHCVHDIGESQNICHVGYCDDVQHNDGDACSRCAHVGNGDAVVVDSDDGFHQGVKVLNRHELRPPRGEGRETECLHGLSLLPMQMTIRLEQ